MLRHFNRTRLLLTKAIASSDTTISVDPGALALLNSMAFGDFALFDISDARGVETVQYTHTAALTAAAGAVVVPVARAIEGVTLNWPRCTVVEASTSETMLRHMICKYAGSC